GARRERRQGLPTRVWPLPCNWTIWTIRFGADGRDFRDRHGCGAPPFFHRAARAEDEYAGRRETLEVFAFPQDQRVRGHAPGWSVAARAVPAQWQRAHLARSLKTPGPAPGSILAGI